MLRLSKKVEYALFALQCMAQQQGRVLTSKEIAECYGLSSELVAKVLGSLARAGIVKPIHGVHGGFVLETDPHQISLARVIEITEGQQFHLIQCEVETGQNCYVEPHCTIRSPLVALQAQIGRIFEQVTVADLLKEPPIQLELPNER